MCLGVPGRIVQIADENGIRMGAGVGDYVVIHAGFGISKVDARAARRTLELIEELEPNKERS